MKPLKAVSCLSKFINQKLKQMIKLLVFRISMIVFLIMNTVVFGKLETESDCFFMLLTFMIGVSYVAAEAYHAFDEAKHNS